MILPYDPLIPPGEVVAQRVPEIGIEGVASFRVQVGAEVDVRVVIERPVVPEVGQVPAAGAAFAIGRSDQPRAASPLCREDAERQREDRHIGDVQRHRPRDNPVADDDFHLGAVEVIMGMLEVACREPSILHKEHPVVDFLDCVSVVQPPFDFRLAEVDLALLRPEVVGNGRPVVSFIAVDQFGKAAELVAGGIGAVARFLRRAGWRCPS